MAPKSDVPASFIEGMQGLLAPIALCMATPDADMGFLTTMQKAVLLKIHEPKPQGSGAPGGAPGQGGPPPPGGAPGGAPGGSPGGPGGAPAGMGMAGGPAGGGAPNPAMPGGGAPEAPTQPGGVSKPMNGLPPDEIRRVLAEQAGE